MTWTDESEDLLKKLWAEGLSASQISGKLGNVTRNAVIGKVHRLGLSGRATTSRTKSPRPRPSSRRIKKKESRSIPRGNPAVRALFENEATDVPLAEELDIPLCERKTFETLEECQCHWPIGDPQAKDFHFCGRPKVPLLPYCEVHARRAFRLRTSRDEKMELKMLQIA